MVLNGGNSVSLTYKAICLNFSKMSIWTRLNRTIFKRTSTFFLACAVGTFFYERTFELVSVSIFKSINKGKLWDDVKDRVTAGGQAAE